MELRHLRYFVALAEELSFTKAAQRLNISQPPLSVQISQLEEQIGTRLFMRTSRSVELTSAGQSFLSDVRTLLRALQMACDRARTIGSGRAGRIDIGLSGSHFQGPLLNILAKYIRDYPEVLVSLHQLMPATQTADLRSGHIDVSISRTRVDDEALVSILLWEDPLVAVLPPDHRLARCKMLTLADLRNEPFVMLKLESSPFAKHIYGCCVQAGYAPQVTQWVMEVPAMMSIVAAGMAVSVAPVSARHGIGDRVAMVPLQASTANSSVYVVRRRGETSAAVFEFVRALTEQAQAAANG